jgi:hypothetical protein
VIKANPDLFKYVSSPIMDTKADFTREIYDNISASPEDCLYAIFDKITAPGKEDTYSNYAGIIALSATNPVNAVTEIGSLFSRHFNAHTLQRMLLGFCSYGRSTHPPLGV